MSQSETCAHRIALGVERRPANALNVEIGTPMPRCRLKTPASWGDVDPRGTRWLLSGGSPFVLGACSARCPLRRARVRSHEAHALALRALEAGLVLHGYDSIGENHVTAGRDIFASGTIWFAIYEGAEKSYSEPAATAIARILVGTREIPGVLGTYPTWGAATVALERAGLS